MLSGSEVFERQAGYNGGPGCFAAAQHDTSVLPDASLPLSMTHQASRMLRCRLA